MVRAEHRWLYGLSSKARFNIAAAVLALSSIIVSTSSAAPPTGLGNISSETETIVKEGTTSEGLSWYDSIENALGVAKEEYRPVVVFFYSPEDGWCGRMKAQTFTDEAVKAQLEHFVRVEVIIEDNQQTAAQYLVRNIPSIRILSADGRIQQGRDGFVSAPEMLRMLRGALNTEFLKKTDPEFQKLITALEKNTIQSKEWPGVMISLGEPQKRETLRQLILKLNPFPRRELVSSLTDSRLAVRLGALEILEELAGDNFGLDPWSGAVETPEKTVALERWSDWLEKSDGEGVTQIHSVLSDAQISSYIRDIIGENRERSVRARTMLRNGGDNAAKALQSFLGQNAEISPAARKRVRELFFALTIPSLGGHDPDTLAHRLVHGNLDSRLETITLLKDSGRAALPILSDFLRDPDPLIRETTADAILSAGGGLAIPLVETHAEGEKDNAVIMAMLRTIGVDEIKEGVKLVAKYADHEDEDLAIMALESLGALRAKDESELILGQLKDERWRIRVASLEAIGKMKDGKHAKSVRPLLSDDDEFVRVAAVQTLASLDDKTARKDLLALYSKHEETRGPVISALLSMKLPLPESLKEDLAESGPDAILSVIDAVGRSRGKQLDAIASFVDHEDLDVSCAALRQVAAYGITQRNYQVKIGQVLEEGTPEKVSASLESLKFHSAQFSAFQRTLGETENATSIGTPPIIEEIYDILLEREPVLTEGEEAPADPLLHLFSEIRQYLGEEHSDSIRHSASILLAKAGDPEAIDLLNSSLDRRSISQRKKIAEGLETAPEGALPVLVKLMRDRSSEVRSAAATAVLEHETDKKFVETLFKEVTRPATKLQPWEVKISYLEDAVKSGSTKGLGNQYARSILEDSVDPTLRSLATITLRHAWKFGDENLLLPLTESEDPLLRRAAWFAIGKNKKNLLTENISKIVSDPSEKVRAVIPFLLDQNGRYWVHYFDDENSQRYYDYNSSSSSRRTRKFDEETRKGLLTLSEDSSPAIRVDSSFLLMSSGEILDAASLESTLSSFPDRESIQTRVSDYLERDYQKLDKSYDFLLNHINPQRISTTDLKKIYAHFGANPEGESAPEYDWVKKDAKADKAPETVKSGNEQEPGNFPDAEESAVELVFFHNPGCKECDRVEEFLGEMKAAFPRLSVQRHNIRESESARLNEALSEKFGVPEKIRMVAPAVFTGDGYLIKDDILPVALGDLIVRSSTAGNSTGGWSALDANSISAASKAIESRFSSVGFAVILSAGILDGINPCAFATIILFLSYLQIARHSPRQILMVGASFILAVFLSYFALGLGLVEVVTRLQFLSGVGMALNWALAIFALIIMLLSIKDGILCLQGRLADTTLQLPVFLKDRIRKVARTGARHRRFVIAAFISGIVISVLELACTGQVYLPTINYMVQEGKGSAYAYLLLYNIAFVLPLVIVFILAYTGLRSEALIEFQRKHSAAIKFATAALFLALFVLLLWQIYR